MYKRKIVSVVLAASVITSLCLTSFGMTANAQTSYKNVAYLGVDGNEENPTEPTTPENPSNNPDSGETPTNPDSGETLPNPTNDELTEAALKAKLKKSKLQGTAHVSVRGDQKGSWNGSRIRFGKTSQHLPIEAFTLKFANKTGIEGNIQYRVYRNGKGWSKWVGNGQLAGQKGKSRRIEAVQMRLTGDLAKYYSIRYRTYMENYKWTQGWQYNGMVAGTSSEKKYVYAIDVQLLTKHYDSGVAYRVYRNNVGAPTSWSKNGATAGSSKYQRAFKTISVSLTGNKYSGGIKYSTLNRGIGWKPYKSNGVLCGSSDTTKPIEALKMCLTGEMAQNYDLYYRVYVQDIGWLMWACNNQATGTECHNKFIQAMQVKLVKKGDKRPSDKKAKVDYIFSGIPDLAKEIVAYAEKFVGTPYVWGGTDLKKGVDCSGYVMMVYKNFGYDLPHNSDAMAECGVEVPIEEIQPGDLIITPGHVAIYYGDNKRIHSYNSKTGVCITEGLGNNILHIRRIINTDKK